VLAALVFLAGCGGDHGGSAKTTSTQAAEKDRAAEPKGEAGGEEGEQKGLEAIPVEDRRAYLQLGVATGELNSSASLLLVKGLERKRDLRALERLRPAVRSLRPADARLRRLRTDVLRALDRAISARRRPGLTRHDAYALLEDAHRALAELKLYSRERPAISSLTPD
jgi:hypothetical protein